MPLRWLLCPVVLIPQLNADTGATSFYRGPKTCLYTEPGRGKPYQHTSVIDTIDWCVSLVRAVDWTPLNADNQIINLLSTDYDTATDLLSQTPRQIGWAQGRVNQLVNVLSNKGVSTTGLTIDTPFETWLDRLAGAVAPWGRCRRLKI